MKEGLAPNIDESKILYAIGDSHGDKNYLTRCLLATERFILDEDEVIQWKPPKDEDNFEVVVLGDFIDRGVLSRENVMLLKRLDETQPKKGGRLVVLMGNHESMMLRFKTTHAHKSGWSNGWKRKAREANLTSSEGEGLELITWLRTRPVVYLTNGALMMHGGLSDPIAAKVAKELKSTECVQEGVRCGEAAMELINAKAFEFYEKLHTCYQEIDEKGSKGRRQAESCAKGVRTPSVLCGSDKNLPVWQHAKKGGGGVLWYRGYSKVAYGAGGADSCEDAKTIGKVFGVEMMMVAHTTHETITEYCDDGVPVFAVDTHYQDCYKTGECDFAVGHVFHKDDIDFAKDHVPQTLVIERGQGGSFASKKCYSQLKEVDDELQINVECTEVTKYRP